LEAANAADLVQLYARCMVMWHKSLRTYSGDLSTARVPRYAQDDTWEVTAPMEQVKETASIGSMYSFMRVAWRHVVKG
jgi:hypothetical protein